uniref:Thioredoxin domain-containing protein n=1 Tax=Aureoumbra lagunensis TaxID=44058 RepID=A0A7S3K057_9STRA|mmetsp:Transcript_8762/g.12178  ORF Transcript_8762/g.12178 Transcript_8762/m.12178 type:complete len:483 (+) Transcript_8762:31-1479(+)|eukprot:CAMPEP_0197289370 /NCGR_PEP_ID=MMETSP0890-20130614/6608_1 /TAXON_ID=44058 ORGANISM="Aureoumbra lagunensis, Strain CCMP1510" /NCGR_SAMPLE_ID=MMETSP0890 /ASSEMBLY_ACC=CAM_ASM_000533 /LENGTH=482 /DNA_ID=CAMNT_0042760733 /DNA_START=47 /DNA_END=1495 /DNA_ORIENTATION=+
MKLRILIALGLTRVGVWAGHKDMFACRSKECPVVELTDANYDTKTKTEPYLVMYYAVWCGHCKALAPKWKKAAKDLEKFSGVKMGAVDIENNRGIQSKYPDIRGFPTIKFVYGNKAEDYNGPREADDLIQFAKERAKKLGSLLEPVASKSFDELYTFFGRAALDKKPTLMLVGQNAKTPDWFSNMHAQLKETSSSGIDDQAKTKLHEALDLAKSSQLRESIQNVLDELATKQKSSAKSKFSAAYAYDDATRQVFNDSTVYVAFVDRKNIAHSHLCAKFVTNTQKSTIQDITNWAHHLHTQAPECDLSMPELPKPPSVLAAEERAARKKAQASSVHSISTSHDLYAQCYHLEKSTCALILSPDHKALQGLDALAVKYARNGFQFAALDTTNAPEMLLTELYGNESEKEKDTALVIIKGGKRPRAARAFGFSAFEKLLDDVLGGGAKFDKFSSGGLPLWPPAEDDEGDGDEGDSLPLDDSDYEL